MERLSRALRRGGQAALPVLAIGPAYAVYLGIAGRAGMTLFEEALPLIRLSFWCSLGVFLAVFGFRLLHPTPR